ncbi:hypothetical protein HaLaN_13180 [Haematococcus lacustris]|uniref:Uncharacterized protein n=1 Tax=Haematococcus lacustris TaxID=44745 RepID=A0A699ZCR4_HAELA|nr:hypothetical protein HaLaN_13180 [Haematococcus lacustris]
MALPTHLVLVVDISGSMRKCDVRCDVIDDEVDEDGDYFSTGPSSSFQSRASAVLGCCVDMVRQQMRGGATGRDRCTMVLFNDAADTVVQNRRFKISLLQDIDCAPGTFTLNTIGLGPDGSEFIWLRKMAAAVGGVYHQDISSSVTKLRSSSESSGLTSTMSGMSLKPDQDDDGGPPRTEVLLGDLLTWDAVTGQHQVTRRGVCLELHHPHFARDGSRPSGVDIAPAGPEPQTCLMKPGQVVIAKEHRVRQGVVMLIIP